MALDPAFVGRRYPSTPPYDVSREKIREFAAAIGETNPACVDVEAARALGYSNVIAPPTFPIVLTFAASRQVIDDPALGLDYSRVVHGEQRFVAHRPIRAGDELVTEVTVESIRSVGGNDILTSRSDVTTVAGEPVVSVYTTLFARAPELEPAPVGTGPR